MCKTPLFGQDTFQVEMFHFDKAGSFAVMSIVKGQNKD